MGASFADVAHSGPMLLAIGAAALAGLVSFLSPCVLPLMPGYLSYVTGLAGADLDDTENRHRGRMLAGTVLFVFGLAVVFTLTTTLVANIGFALTSHARVLNVVLGVIVIVLGLMFMGAIPGLQREFRIHRAPAAGLIGAPVLGGLFALSWLPCTGPTLGAVLGLATTSGHTDRAVTLALAYSLGLGIPFVLFGLFFRKLIGVVQAIRRHSRWVTRIGGGLLVLVGLALVTGGWNSFLIWLQTTFNFDAGTLL
jgi:cytochrome c-type biogenesis protein